MKRYNVRMAGIGGQGVVTASHILSNAVIIGKGESTLVPFFGSEKRMAPVESYVRIAEGQIYEIGEIIFPNVIMIFSAQVITQGKSYTMPFYSGLKQGGIVLINSGKPIALKPDEERELLERDAKVFYIAATEMAIDVAGTDLATNMAMVGGIVGILGIPDMESVAQSVRERFLGKGFVVSGGTASLDSTIEKKFKKKEELLSKNMDTIKAAQKYAVDNGWPQIAAAEKGAMVGATA